MESNPAHLNKDLIEAPSANLTVPMNESVRQANAGQFALMLSLAFEAQQIRPVDSSLSTSPAVKPARPDEMAMGINGALGKALQTASTGHFNLLKSLYAERVIVADTVPFAEQRETYQSSERKGFRERRGSGSVLEEIEGSKVQAERMAAA